MTEVSERTVCVSERECKEDETKALMTTDSFSLRAKGAIDSSGNHIIVETEGLAESSNENVSASPIRPLLSIYLENVSMQMQNSP